MLRPQRGRMDRAEQQVQTGELEGAWRGPFTSSSEHTTKCAQCHSHHTQTTLSFYLKYFLQYRRTRCHVPVLVSHSFGTNAGFEQITSHLFALCNVSPRLLSSSHLPLTLLCVCCNSRLQDRVSAKENREEKRLRLWRQVTGCTEMRKKRD